MASPLKNDYKKAKQNNRSPNSTDRLSELPDEIIHHILGFIPTIKAVRSSLLSRRWRQVWRSVPSLHFSSTDQRCGGAFIVECLNRRDEDQHRLDSASTVTSFTVDDVSLSPSAVADAVTRLLKCPKTIGNIKNLNLCLSEDSYCFPHELLDSTTLTDVNFTTLRLDGLDPSVKVNLPSLTSLCLWDVLMSDRALSHLLSGCPSLAKLELMNCSGLNHPKISSSSLVSFGFFTACEEIHFEATNLRSLVLSCGCETGFDISSCVAIRSLEICNCVVGNKLWRDIERKFTLLESLRLSNCFTFEEIAISSQSLKTLALNKHFNVKLVANFKTPTLTAFVYEGDLKFGMSMNSPSDRLKGEIKIRTECPYSDNNFYSKLFKFVSSLNWSCNNMLTIDVISGTPMLQLSAKLFMKDANGHPIWPGPKHMKVYHCQIGRGASELKTALERFSNAQERNPNLGTPLLREVYRILYYYYNRSLFGTEELRRGM